MEEATDPKPPAKRARFADDVATTATTTTTTNEDTSLPKKLAEAHIIQTAASLHPQIAPIVTRLGKLHLLLLCKRDQKQKAVQRLIDDDNAIPRSARFQFTLSAPKRTEASLEYTTLQEKAKAIVTQCGIDLKKVIIQAAKLEIATMDSEIKTDLALCIRLITQAFLIVNNDATNCDNKVHQLASLHIASLSKNASMDINEFCDVYKKTHTLESFPVRVPRETIEIDHSDSMFANQIARPTQAADNTNNNLDSIKQTIESVLITAWSKYTEQQQKNKIALELKKLSASFFTEQATEQSIIEVDQEPAADKVELKALIRQETKAETKLLEKKIDDLTKQITAALANTNSAAKNSNTGGRQQGAPPNQRNTNRDPWWQKPPSDRNSNNNNNTNPSQTVTLGRSTTNERTPNDTTRRDNNNNNYYGPSNTSQENENDQADGNSNDSAHGNRNSRMSSGQQRSNTRNSQFRGRQNKH